MQNISSETECNKQSEQMCVCNPQKTGKHIVKRKVNTFISFHLESLNTQLEWAEEVDD